jgi:diguanylate cyclase (GGDEF)-like protein
MDNSDNYRDSLAFADVSLSDRCVAGFIAAACIIAVFAIEPFASRPAPENNSVLPAVVFVSALALALTAAILYSQYSATSHVPLAVLGHAYTASAILALAYILSAPKAFSDTGLFGAHRDTAAWLVTCWRLSFIVLVGLFVVLKWRIALEAPSEGNVRFSIWWSSLALGVAVTAMIVFAIRADSTVPEHGNGIMGTAFLYDVMPPVTFVLDAVVLLALFAVTRFRTLVSLWLAVMLLVTLAELAMASFVPAARYSYGWYFARAEWSVAATAFYLAMKVRMMQIMGALSRRNKELLQLATVDELTGVLNQRGFTGRFERVARQAARSGDCVVVIAIDIDEFKRYNDEFGHPAGSKVLAAVGSALRGAGLRTDDFCGRIGGDEFVIVLFGVDVAGSLAVAERARRSIKMLNIRQASDAATETLTVSIGIASNEGDKSIGTADLVAHADQALYRAKRSGRDRISIAPPFSATDSLGQAG